MFYILVEELDKKDTTTRNEVEEESKGRQKPCLGPLGRT
jgi:hypothetical protein